VFVRLFIIANIGEKLTGITVQTCFS